MSVSPDGVLSATHPSEFDNGIRIRFSGSFPGYVALDTVLVQFVEYVDARHLIWKATD
jgi:hypothetical protein